MLVCGQEEPLQVNEMLYALNEETGVGELSYIEDPRLNRYSFMWLGEQSETDDVFTRLIQALLERSHTTATWVLAWWHYQIEGFGTAKERWWLAKHKKAGWTIYTATPLSLAMKPRDPGDDGFQPPGDSNGQLLLFLGPPPTLDSLANGPPRPSMVRLSRGSNLAPSRQFLDWLAEHRRTVVYTEQDDLGRIGLVIVGPGKLPTATLQAQAIIQEIKTGVEAELVWRYGWKH